MGYDDEYERYYAFKDFDGKKWKWPEGSDDYYQRNKWAKPEVSNLEVLEAIRRQERQIMGLHDEFRRLQMALSCQMYELAEKLEKLSKIITPTSLELKHSLDDLIEKTDADDSSVPV